ncbi:hypothetical protein DevBK_02460 [Devosia sp. BK]|uniref:hypothetical protein n=1 Tax=Devosia sp. BK TaxID=2871706 RepID=UPI002939BD1C|nr:hypothetical protein [Devosia sp. BK]MDV3250189.1 hypothetical protein [Devosia sp. BK]
MSDYYLSRLMDNGDLMCISPISSEVAAANNMQLVESYGYFLLRKKAKRRSQDVEILARLPSEDAAFELSKILGLS